MKKIYVFLFFISTFSIFGEDIDFLQKQDLTDNVRKYPYASTFSLGISPNYFPLIATNAGGNNVELKNVNLRNFFSIGVTLQHSWILTNMFLIKTFGFIPKIGFAVQFFSMNYVRAYFEEIFKYLGKLFICNPNWNPQTLLNSHFVINIPVIFEPEINIFSRFRCVPQLGIGISIINLTRDCVGVGGNKTKLYPKYIDLLLFSKVTFIWKNKYTYETKFELGYTYNPLIGYDFGADKKTANKAIEGGLMNVFLGINFSWYFNLGRETIDWFDPSLKNIKYINKTLFIEGCLGLGNWYKMILENDVSSKKYVNILISLNLPYLRELTNVLYYGVSFDFFEDFFNDASKNNTFNIFQKAINNFNTVFNFASFSFVYKTIRITHNLGIYVFTNLWDIFSKQQFTQFGQREISEFSGDKNSVKDNISILNYIIGRFTYRPRIYINIPKMIRKRAKYNFLNKFSLVIGVNTILFDRRNDWRMKAVNQINFEFIKIESVFVGISYEV